MQILDGKRDARHNIQYYWAVQRWNVIGSEKRIDELRKHLMSNVGGWRHH